MLAIRMGFGKGRLMSALGHKRTFAVQNGMSALPPKADIDRGRRNVCFVPIADIRLLGVKAPLWRQAGLSPSLCQRLGQHWYDSKGGTGFR